MKILISVVFLLLVVVLGYFLFFGIEKEAEIIFTDNGFAPQRITIKARSSLTFINKSESDFWPASNIHPTHEIYPGFDAAKPIAPASSWSFRFDKVGEWRYHDHLAPQFSGVIIVE